MKKDASLSLSFKKIPGMDENVFNKLKATLEQLPYHEEGGWGFRNGEFTDQSIQIEMIVRYPTTITEFDFKSQIFEQKMTDAYAMMPLRIDAKHRLLELSGPKQHQERALSILAELMEYQSIEDVTIDPAFMLGRLRTTNAEFHLTQIVISQFKYYDSMAGRYSATILDEDSVTPMLGDYSSDIAQMTLNLDLAGMEGVLTVSNKGTLRLKCEVTLKEVFLEALRELIFGWN